MMRDSSRRLQLITHIGRRCLASASQATSPSPTLLTKVREDLKAAMRAKDAARLDVLRGLISDVTNANKTSRPIATDSDMLQLIRKRVKSSQEATHEALAAQREDLAERERKQVALLEFYVEGSNAMGVEDITAAVREVIAGLKADGKQCDKGSVMKALIGPNGSLQQQLVDKKELAKAVDGML